MSVFLIDCKNGSDTWIEEYDNVYSAISECMYLFDTMHPRTAARFIKNQSCFIYVVDRIEPNGDFNNILFDVKKFV